MAFINLTLVLIDVRMFGPGEEGTTYEVDCLQIILGFVWYCYM